MGLRTQWEAFQLGEQPDICCKNAWSTANTEIGGACGEMTSSHEAGIKEKPQQRRLARQHCNEGNTGISFCLHWLSQGQKLMFMIALVVSGQWLQSHI